MAKLRFGLVGGGYGAFIGQVHRMAAELDGLLNWCAGIFSDPSVSARVHIVQTTKARSYPSFSDVRR